MQIIVKGANFTDLAIGTQIDIPAALSTYIQNMGDMNAKKISALITLYNTLVDNGIWQKFDKLYLPILASSLSKAMINAKTSLTDIVLSNKYTLEVGKGLKQTYSGQDDDRSDENAHISYNVGRQLNVGIATGIYQSVEPIATGIYTGFPSYCISIGFQSSNGNLTINRQYDYVKLETNGLFSSDRIEVTQEHLYRENDLIVGNIIDATTGYVYACGNKYDINNMSIANTKKIDSLWYFQSKYPESSVHNVCLKYYAKIAFVSLEAFTKTECDTMRTAFETFCQALK